MNDADRLLNLQQGGTACAARVAHLERMIASHERTIANMARALTLLRTGIEDEIAAGRAGDVVGPHVRRLEKLLAASETHGPSAATANDAIAAHVAGVS